MMTKFTQAFLIILGLLSLLGVGVYFIFSANLISGLNLPSQKACTLDAKICPDGSAVGRTGPNCEFAECPSVRVGPTIAPILPGKAVGVVLLGPNCPVTESDADGCPDKPYQTNLVVTDESGNRVIKEFSSDEKGLFSIELANGRYKIRSSSSTPPVCSSEVFEIKLGSQTPVEVLCDTGLR